MNQVLIKHFLYAEDPCEAKYQLLINKRKKYRLKVFKLLLNTQIIWMIFIKTLKNTVQTKNEKHCLYLMI